MIKPNWIALLKPNNVISWLAYEIWIFAERFNIPLGRLAPHIFGLMMGKKGKRVQ